MVCPIFGLRRLDELTTTRSDVKSLRYIRSDDVSFEIDYVMLCIGANTDGAKGIGPRRNIS